MSLVSFYSIWFIELLQRCLLCCAVHFRQNRDIGWGWLDTCLLQRREGHLHWFPLFYPGPVYCLVVRLCVLFDLSQRSEASTPSHFSFLPAGSSGAWHCLPHTSQYSVSDSGVSESDRYRLQSINISLSRADLHFYRTDPWSPHLSWPCEDCHWTVVSAAGRNYTPSWPDCLIKSSVGLFLKEII